MSELSRLVLTLPVIDSRDSFLPILTILADLVRLRRFAKNLGPNRPSQLLPYGLSVLTWCTVHRTVPLDRV